MRPPKADLQRPSATRRVLPSPSEGTHAPRLAYEPPDNRTALGPCPCERQAAHIYNKTVEAIELRSIPQLRRRLGQARLGTFNTACFAALAGAATLWASTDLFRGGADTVLAAVYVPIAAACTAVAFGNACRYRRAAAAGHAALEALRRAAPETASIAVE